MFIYFGWVNYEWNDIREISIYISHIRLALMMVFGFFILLFLIREEKTKILKYTMIFALLNLGFFIYILNSYTGYFTFGFIAVFSIVYFSLKAKNCAIKYGGIFSSIIFVAIIIFKFWTFYKKYENEKEYKKPYDTFTVNNNKYYNNDKVDSRENGYQIWVYISKEEIYNEWPKRSDFDIKNKDLKGQEIYFTCIRYLASKGLRKDSVGIWSLDLNDIRNIEKGYANYLFAKKYSLYSKFYPVFWQVDRYLSGGNPQGHSITMRAEYLKIALFIIKKNFWFGVGTGDAKIEFQKAYKRTNSVLDQKHRKRAHNQYVTFILSYGTVGFLLIMSMIIYPIIIKKGFANYYFTVFLILFLLSMGNEDTLETHTAVSFVGFWYSFLLFGITSLKDNSNKK
jgi:hypothetical protein